MKVLGKIFWGILFAIYVVVAVGVTILVMSYNDYGCTELGGYTYVIIKDDELEPTYNSGDLVLVKQTKAKNINEGENIFLYRNVTANEYEIKYANVMLKNDESGEENIQFILEGNTIIDAKDVIGSEKGIKVIPHMGTVLSILESQYGYLFLIVVVSVVLLLYEIYELIVEIKYGEEEEKEKDKI